MDFLRPGLKTGVGNGIFWSEIGSGFGDMGGTPPKKISTSSPPPRALIQVLHPTAMVCLELSPLA